MEQQNNQNVIINEIELANIEEQNEGETYTIEEQNEGETYTIGERVEVFIDDPEIVVARYSSNDNIIHPDSIIYNVIANARYSNQGDMTHLIIFKYVVSIIPIVILIWSLLYFEDLYINYLEKNEQLEYLLFFLFITIALSVSWNIRCYISKFINFLYLITTIFINVWIYIYNFDIIISIIFCFVFLFITSYLMFYNCKNSGFLNHIACILILPLFLWIFFTIIISLEKLELIIIF